MTLRRKAQLHIWDRRMLNGHAGNVSKATKRYIMRGVAAGLVCTSTTGGTHAPGSYHYPRPGSRTGRAADLGLPDHEVGTAYGQRKMEAFQRREHRLHGRRYLELFGPVNNACRKDGRPLRLAEGAALETLHDNHVHGACRW